MSFLSRIFGSAKKQAPTNIVVQAIEQADVAANKAQRQVDELLNQLKVAQADKVKILKASQIEIQVALAADQDALEAEKVRHQNEISALEESFRLQREAIERRKNQLAEIEQTTVTAVNDQFNGKVNDAESRAAAAQRELDRIQSQLGNKEQQ